MSRAEVAATYQTAPGPGLNRVTIRRDTCDALVRHSAGCMPNEACALLLGRVDGIRDAVIIEDALLMENARGSPVGFAIADDQLIRAYGAAEERRMEVVGVFHSHPGSPAVPSPTDERYMVLNPVAWLIYSGTAGGIRAWVMRDGTVEIPLEITQAGSRP